MIPVPFLCFNIYSLNDTFAVDCALEQLDMGPLNVNLMYMVAGGWHVDMMATCTWSYARIKIEELFDVVDTSILCTVFMGAIHDQTIGNVDDFWDENRP